MTPLDDTDREFFQMLNEDKKELLADKYGMMASYTDPAMPPDAESRWLDQMINFEEQWENAKRIPLREFLGNPTLKPLALIPAGEVEAELERLEGLMAWHGVVLDRLVETPAAEIYRFIVEELLDEEIDDVRIEGMRSHYIYEEFHPNDDYGSKMWAENFLSDFFRKSEYFRLALDKEELYDATGAPITQDEMLAHFLAFWEQYPTVTSHYYKPTSSEIEGDYATVQVETYWHGKQKDGTLVSFQGQSTIRLKRSPWAIGAWEVIQARIVGWE